MDFVIHFADHKDPRIFTEIGEETLLRLASFFGQKVSPKMAPLVSIFFLLSQFIGPYNHIYHSRDLVSQFAGLLLCGITRIVTELSFAISNFIVESKFLCELYYDHELIDALVNLIHQRKDPSVVQNALFCLNNLGDQLNTDQAWGEYIRDFKLIEQLMNALLMRNLDVKYGVIDLLYNLLRFDCEDEWGVRTAIQSHPNYQIIGDTDESEGPKMQSAVVAFMDLIMDI